MTVDFHSHTRESDGTLAPPELVARMKRRGVSWFSITDHDTTRAYDQVDAPGQRVVTGVEINTTWNGADVHILGFRIPTGPSPIAEVLERNRAHRRRRIDVMLSGLAAAGYPLTVEQVLAEAPAGHALGRPHVAKALVRHGIVRDVQAAFDQLLSRGKAGYAPSNHITPIEAIDGDPCVRRRRRARAPRPAQDRRDDRRARRARAARARGVLPDALDGADRALPRARRAARSA